MPSPQVTVSDNGGTPVDPVASGIGVNVIAGHAIVIQLQNLAADTWSCPLVGRDDQVTPPTFTLDPIGKKVAFTAPAGPFSLIFESVVNNGQDINGDPVDAYRQRFGIFCLTAAGTRVLASNERNETNALFGWAKDVNDALRLVATAIAAANGLPQWQAGGDSAYQITGTNVKQIVVVPTLTAARTWVMPTAPVDGLPVDIFDLTGVLVDTGNTLSVTTQGGTDHFFYAGADKGTTWQIPASIFKRGTVTLTRRASTNSWDVE
jgi:hypothetical protein